MPGGDGKKKIVYSGIVKVLVAGRTPVTMTYNIKHQCCTTTFYVQRYNEDDVPLDATLQNQLNGSRLICLSTDF